MVNNSPATLLIAENQQAEVEIERQASVFIIILTKINCFCQLYCDKNQWRRQGEWKERPYPEIPGKFAKDGKQPKPQPAASLDIRR